MKFITALLLFCVAAGCARQWETSYTEIDQFDSTGYHISSVSVVVPRSLSVSEANSIFPSADIVWRGDFPGNRYDQVADLFGEAATITSKRASGDTAVRLEITVLTFHGITDRARGLVDRGYGGVYNIRFDIAVFDAQSNQLIHREDGVKAQIEAIPNLRGPRFPGEPSEEKRYVISHLSEVIAGLLDLGPDVRREFSRVGA